MECKKRISGEVPVTIVTMGDECPVVDVSWGAFLRKLNDEEVLVIPLERAAVLQEALSSYSYAQAVILLPDEKKYCWFKLKAFIIKEHDEKDLFKDIASKYPLPFEALLIGKILEVKQV